MALREDFENQGNWLFRYRSYLPLGMLVLVLYTLKNYTYPGNSETLDHVWEAACLLISFFGLGIRVITIGYTPRGTSGRNTRKQVAETLNTSGIYSVVRNPLYLGNFFMGFGIVLFAHLWWLLLIYTLVFWLYYERIIFAEEAFLRNRFGTAYLAWAEQTPAFIPNFKNYRKAELSFSVRNVLRREYNGFFAIIVTLMMLEIIGDLVIKGRFNIEPGWLVLFGSGFAVWFVLRWLKRHTLVLNVPGR